MLLAELGLALGLLILFFLLDHTLFQKLALPGELLLLLLVTFFRDALLLDELSELYLIEGLVPVDGLLILELFLRSVVGHDKRLRLGYVDTLEAIL